MAAVFWKETTYRSADTATLNSDSNSVVLKGLKLVLLQLEVLLFAVRFCYLISSSEVYLQGSSQGKRWRSLSIHNINSLAFVCRSHHRTPLSPSPRPFRHSCFTCGTLSLPHGSLNSMTSFAAKPHLSLYYQDSRLTSSVSDSHCEFR